MPPRRTRSPRSRPLPSDDPLRDATRGERLQRVMADAGVASRRACEELVLAGEVSVNGRIVDTLPAFVDPDEDRIVVSGRPMRRRAERRLYVMLYKPVRTVSTATDPEGRRTVMDLVQHPSGIRLYPVGRLDYETAGLILMTNDGELANRLTHPRFGVHKTYRAVLRGRVENDELLKIERGVVLTDRRDGKTVGASRTAPVCVDITHRDNEKTVVEISLREGRNRQIRRMMSQIKHPVRKLMRVAMGPLALKGVAMGQWRELTLGEIRALRRAAEAGVKRAGGPPGPPKAKPAKPGGRPARKSR